MNQITIKQLIQINKAFYENISQDFDRTRAFDRDGWKKIYQIIEKDKKTKIKVLDLGCGNGLWGECLGKRFGKRIEYWGVDNNQQLLDIAVKKLKDVRFKSKIINSEIIIRNWEKIFQKLKFDVIGVFGLMHHIPSLKLRRRLVERLAELLVKDGMITISFWQILNKERFMNKIVSWDRYNMLNNNEIDINQLEPGDCLLNWSNQNNLRYCHMSSDSEIEKICKIKDFHIIDDYIGDGKTKDLNKYVILQHNIED